MGLCGSARCGCQFAIDDSNAPGINMVASGTGESGNPFTITVTSDLASILSSSVDNVTLEVNGSTGKTQIKNGGVTAAKVSAEPWTTYTPTWTATGGSPAVGSGGTLQGRYMQRGKDVHIEIVVRFGSSPTIAGTGWTFSLPSGMSPRGTDAKAVVPLFGWAWDDSAGSGVGVCMAVRQDPGPTGVGAVFVSHSSASVGAAAPFAWAANDSLIIKGTIEVD